MRIAVLGAGGRTGRLVVAECERRNHEVVAVTRRTALAGAGPGTRIVSGAVTDPAVLCAELAGVDAVISTIPGGDRSDPNLAERTARSLLPAMTDSGVSRLVITSAYPLVAEQPRLMLWILRRVLRVPYADTARMEEVVSGSDLEWTIVRLNRLTDAPPAGTLDARSTLLPRATRLSRADVAVLLVDQAERSTGRCALNVGGAGRARPRAR